MQKEYWEKQMFHEEWTRVNDGENFNFVKRDGNFYYKGKISQSKDSIVIPKFLHLYSHVMRGHFRVKRILW